MIASTQDPVQSDAEGTAESDGGPTRDGSRDSIFLSASIWFGPGAVRHDVRVRNISAGGMMIDFPQARPVGTAIHAEIKGVGEIEGVVAWANANRLGVRFAGEIDPDAARYRPEPMAVPVPGVKLPPNKSRRPGLAVR